MSELREIIAPIIGNRRKFMLLRVADMPVEESLKLCNTKNSTYHSWLQDELFVNIYRQRDALSLTNKQEAITLLRRENQLAAVMLEGKIIERLKEEIESKEYQLIKTRIAGEVYSKLVSDLDMRPPAQKLTWQQFIGTVVQPPPMQIQEVPFPSIQEPSAGDPLPEDTRVICQG